MVADMKSGCSTVVAKGNACPQKIGRAHAELQSHNDLVCRLLLEKKKKKTRKVTTDKRNTYNRYTRRRKLKKKEHK